MNQQDEQRRGLSDNARANIRAWRLDAGMSTEELARRVTETGVPMARNVVVNLERGKRRELSVEELAAFALALNVAPADLVLPPDDDLVTVTSSHFGMRAHVRAWWCGERPFSQDEDDEEFYRRAPSRIRDRHVRLVGNPTVETIESLSGLVEDALTRSRTTQGHEPPAIAAALRRDLDRVRRHVELLAEQFEAASQGTGDDRG